MNNLYYGFRGDPGQRAAPQSLSNQAASQGVLPSKEQGGGLALSSASAFPPVNALNGSLRHPGTASSTPTSGPFNTQPWASDLPTSNSHSHALSHAQGPLPSAGGSAAPSHHHTLGLPQQQELSTNAHPYQQSLRPNALGLSTTASARGGGSRLQVPARQAQYDDMYHMMNKGGYPEAVSGSNGPVPTHADPILTGRLQQQSDVYARHAQVGSSAVFDPNDFPTLGAGNSNAANIPGSSNPNPTPSNNAITGSSGFDSINAAYKSSMPISLNGHPYSELYNLGAYSNPRSKAVDALTGTGPSPEFSMQSEDFPVLGGGNDGNANRTAAGANPSQHFVNPIDSATRNQRSVIGMDRPSASAGDAFYGVSSHAPNRSQFATGSTSQLAQPSMAPGSSSTGLPSSSHGLLKKNALPPSYLRQEQSSSVRQMLTPNDDMVHLPGGRNRDGLPPVSNPQGVPESGAQAANNTYMNYSVREQRNVASYSTPNGPNFDGNTAKRENLNNLTNETLTAFQGLSLESRDHSRVLGAASSSGLPVGGEKFEAADKLADASRKRTGENDDGDMSESELYGMKGLLRVLNPPPHQAGDVGLLSLGIDLTQLGLDLNSTEPLHASMESPWDDYRRLDRSVQQSQQQEPEFKLPPCYYMSPPALKTSHFTRFQLETLFYIFYSLPKDLLQALAAVELHRRSWRYHKELKLWFTRAPGTDSSYERGAYIYFDISCWERRPFHDANMQFVQDLLSDEELQSCMQLSAQLE